MSRIKIAFIIVVFTSSGAVGLVYEVLWQRQLALIFGTTLPATTAVLATFMGGLALGSIFFGKLADCIKRPFRLYGLLELGVGIYCLNIPRFFRFVEDLHIVMFRQHGDVMILQVARFVLLMIILTIPCALMGGTLPALIKALVRNQSKIGKAIAFLYSINTFGAVIGTLFAGFILIPRYGLSATTAIAISVNISIGLIFLFLPLKTAITEDSQESSSFSKHWLLFVYFLMGSISMGTEIAWTRALNLTIGSTVYAFTMMLAAYLLGIAMGSLFSSSLMDRFKLEDLFSFLTIASGFSIAFSIIAISRLPVILLSFFPRFHHSFIMWQCCLFFIGVMVIFPATFCLGAIFPVISRLYISQLKNVGKKIGSIYLCNTFGGIAGTLTTSFLFIPIIGTRNSLLLFFISFVLIGSIVSIIMSKEQRNWRTFPSLVALSIILIFVLPEWDAALLDSGVYVYAPELLNGFEANRKILFEEEGVHSYVTVSEKAGVRSLRINGKTDGSDGGDLTTQILLAHLPLIQKTNTKRTLVIGLGTGVTFGSALTYTDNQVDCIEIDSEVIKASRLFDHVSGAPILDPNGQIIEADARIVLKSISQKYDVIISEPSNPWITGVSNLFTTNHFLACLDALQSDGMMCQWIHSYYLDTETLFIVFRSFASVFSNCSLWQASPGDYLLIGSRIPDQMKADKINKNFEIDKVKNDLSRINIANYDQLIERLILTDEELENLVRDADGLINTDDRPVVEFRAPQSLYRNTAAENHHRIMSYKKSPAI